MEGECADYRFIVDRLEPMRLADCEYIGGPGEYHGYTVDGVTMTEPVFHKVNYYDNYRFLDDGLMPATVADGSFDYVSTPGYGEKYVSAKGRLTGVLTAVSGSAGGFLGGAFYYDERGRLIQSRSSNLLNGLETESVAYNFMGQPVKRLHVHSAPGKNTLSEVYTYTYDDTGLPMTTKHQLGHGTETALSDKVYDALGRLSREKQNGNANLLTGYSYNVRSWLTEITGGKFTQNLHYTDRYGTACYNGNLSSMTWKTGNESNIRRYKFDYDGVNRLASAMYGETASIGSNADRFTERVTGYDSNGNITGLQRYGQTSVAGYGLVDNLSFTLDGNRLNRVDDATTASAYNGSFEFKDGASQAGEYAYDANGNLTKDLNKNIIDIQYNVLNLPSKVVFSDGSVISYVYAADGTKLRTVHTIGGAATTTDYCGNVVYENGVQKLLLTETGYVTLNDGKYHYYLQDHQGNNRVVMSQDGSVEETNHYYPFGGVFASSGNVQPYKYNGKELDTKKGLDLYDYGARQYDAALGRFTTVDPSAENYYPVSPYAYCGNNPVNRVDPTGTDWYEDKDGNWSWQEGSKKRKGYTNLGASVSIQLGEDSYFNAYQNAGIIANKAVNAFDLIASSAKLQNQFLGKDSPLSENSKSSLFNSLNSRSVDAIARPIGEAIVEMGAGEFGGALLGKAIGWAVGKAAGKGYATFTDFKKAQGSAGPGMAWHHIVEQNAANIATFGAEQIHNTKNVIRLPHGKGSIHAKISGYYSSKMRNTNIRVRDYVNTLSYDEQYKFGIEILKQFGWKL